MINRVAASYLNRWYHKSHRKPLVLRGARQVGKSTLIRRFATQHKLTLHEINLERHLDLDDIFTTLDLDVIIRELESVVGGNIQQANSLLFLDEIQATPHALQALLHNFGNNYTKR